MKINAVVVIEMVICGSLICHILYAQAAQASLYTWLHLKGVQFDV